MFDANIVFNADRFLFQRQYIYFTSVPLEDDPRLLLSWSCLKGDPKIDWVISRMENRRITSLTKPILNSIGEIKWRKKKMQFWCLSTIMFLSQLLSVFVCLFVCMYTMLSPGIVSRTTDSVLVVITDDQARQICQNSYILRREREP